MFDVFSNLALGFGTALSLQNLAYAFIGCFIGTAIGVLPGLGPLATIAMLLPITYALEPAPALIMLAGIFYGSQYGGSTTAILVNLPGESSSAITALDGYKMARNGRAGPALAAAAIGSFAAGTIGTVFVAAFAVPLSKVAFSFGSVEYTSLMLLGFVAAVVMSSDSIVKSFAMVLIGLLISTIGMDINSGAQRFTFGLIELDEGIELTVVAMGMFGFAEIISNLTNRMEDRDVFKTKIGTLMPTRKDMRAMIPAILRGSGIGTILGLLPGGGALLASFASYAAERGIATEPGEPKLGEGNIRGVAGPESANNAGAQTSFIPLLTLGIPTGGTMAILLGAMMIHDIAPGPTFMTQKPEIFWGLVASMWIGNAMLLILNLPAVGLWVKLLSVPYRWLFPAIVVFCSIGAYTLKYSVFEIWLIALFGLAGFFSLICKCQPTPLILGLVLGGMLEENLRRSLLLSEGNWTVFATSPISAGFLAVAVALIAATLLPKFRKTREEAFAE